MTEAEVGVGREKEVEAETETGREAEAGTEEEAGVETGKREVEVVKEDVEVEARIRKEDTEVEVEVKKVNGETEEKMLTKLQIKLLTKMKQNSFVFTMEKFKISQLLDVLFN